MKSSTLFQERLAGIAAWLYAVWQSRDLSHAWMDSPYDKAGFLAFLIWCLPVLLKIWRESPMRMGWFAAGVLISLAGSIGELNFVKYAGLAVVTCGFLPPGRVSWVQLAGAVCWMPLLGWVISSGGVTAVNSLRVITALVTVFVVLRPPAFLR
ncbi:MAG: hypothetical protein V4726_06465 [Verrucomicrobiota bacterium]